MATVRAELKGEWTDLGILAESFPVTDGSGVMVADGGTYWLRDGALTGRTDDAPAWATTAELALARLNGIARSLSPSYQLVTLSGRFYDEDDNQHSGVFAGTIQVRSHVRARRSGTRHRALRPS
jgi:hypothetical protein